MVVQDFSMDQHFEMESESLGLDDPSATAGFDLADLRDVKIGRAFNLYLTFSGPFR